MIYSSLDNYSKIFRKRYTIYYKTHLIPYFQYLITNHCHSQCYATYSSEWRMKWKIGCIRGKCVANNIHGNDDRYIDLMAFWFHMMIFCWIITLDIIKIVRITFHKYKHNQINIYKAYFIQKYKTCENDISYNIVIL